MDKYLVLITWNDGTKEKRWHTSALSAWQDYHRTANVVGKGTTVRVCELTQHSWYKDGEHHEAPGAE